MKKLIDAAESLLKKGEITQEEFGMVKEAVGWPMDIKGFQTSAKSVLGPVALGSMGALALSHILKPIIQKVKIGKSYEALVEKNPVLAEKDPGQIKDYFNVIQTFSPKAASNPLVAGALINKMMEFGGVDHKLVQDIAAIESGIESINPFETLATSASKAFVGAGND